MYFLRHSRVERTTQKLPDYHFLFQGHYSERYHHSSIATVEDLLVVPDTLDFHAGCRAVDFSPIFRTRRDNHNHEPCQRKNIIDNHGHLTEGYDCFERHDEGNSDGDDNEYGDHGNTDGEDNSDEEDNSDSDWDGSDETDDGNDDSSDYDSEDDYPSESDSKPTYREWIDYEPSIIPYFHL
ncbi:hypothetical protein D6D06_05575 [Aureobasidium pullulans]|nr:hypothetical protein D6D06_05575 [Aureobasidium pullulans]